jgi:amidase
MLNIVQVKPIEKGTPEYEEKRAALLEFNFSKVPQEYRLPADLIANPPLGVSDIPRTCGILTEEEVQITENYDAFGLAEAIANRKYTAVAVATAFAKRAIIAHQLVCCLTQWFMVEAVARAKELDEYLEKNRKTIGPLHGVPISIKEHIWIAGTDSSAGSFSSMRKDKKDSQMVSILRDFGAVFYCKTNQPQAIMHLESTGHYGRTLNPFNINLSAGGSTGGEAALVAMKGSVMGVGTDIGGSVRGPSAFCGIYGFKPTSYTLPMRGYLESPFAAEVNVLTSTGPMCRSLRDMDLFMRLILDAKPYLIDPRIVPIPWMGLKAGANKPLKIGIISNDGFIEPQPPVRRAIAWAKEQLSNPKYADLVEIKPFMPFDAKEAWSKIRRIYYPDGGSVTVDAIRSTGEPVHPLTKWITKVAEPSGMQTAQDVNLARRERDDYRIAFAENWQEQDVDVVIGPAFVGPACAHDTALYWTYTSLYNFVDYPGVVFPTPIKATAKEEYAENYVPLSDECKHVKELWEASNFEGAPIDLQINARKYHDNELFAALEVLRGILSLP